MSSPSLLKVEKAYLKSLSTYIFTKSLGEQTEMKLTPDKKRILEILWKAEKPIKPREVAEKTGLGFRSSMMHLLGLRNMAYVQTPEKGYYAITELGKKTIGVPEIGERLAITILRSRPMENAFLFHTGIGQYTGIFATSLVDFCDKLQEVDAQSVEFHVSRGDFESWVRFLGDTELAGRIHLIRDTKLSGEKLRREVSEAVKTRLKELKRAYVST